MKVIKLESAIKPEALKVAMGYRKVTVVKLSNSVKGLKREDLVKFLDGFHAAINEDMLKQIMEFLEFPFEFLFKDFKPLKTSIGKIEP